MAAGPTRSLRGFARADDVTIRLRLRENAPEMTYRRFHTHKMIVRFHIQMYLLPYCRVHIHKVIVRFHIHKMYLLPYCRVHINEMYVFPYCRVHIHEIYVLPYGRRSNNGAHRLRERFSIYGTRNG